MPEISRDYLRSILDYDLETGVFTWKFREDVPREWNTKNAGRTAGSKSVALGYVLISVNKQRLFAHRLAWLWMTGAWPEHQIDHRDRDRGNTAWSNLRSATKAQNMQNGKPCKGYYWHSQKSKWHASIRVNGARKSLGLFEHENDAAAAYANAAAAFHGDFYRAS